MRRALQLLIVYAAAFVCALLAASCSHHEAGVTISEKELAKGLRHKFPQAQLILEDEVYQTVPSEQVMAALNRARLPYRANVADCDDVTFATMHHLMRPRWGSPSAVGAPAAGRVAAMWDGLRHSFVWHVDEAGKIAITEPYTGQPVTRIQAWRVQDK
jgi:hypothetical protein